MMFGKAADFNRDMYQVNIASMDVLMQLVQVVDSMREGQGVIIDAIEHMSDAGAGGRTDEETADVGEPGRAGEHEVWWVTVVFELRVSVALSEPFVSAPRDGLSRRTR